MALTRMAPRRGACGRDSCAADPSGGQPRLEPALRFEMIGIGRERRRDPVLGQCFFVTTLALERPAKAEPGVVVGRVDFEDAFEGGFGPAEARRTEVRPAQEDPQ